MRQAAPGFLRAWRYDGLVQGQACELMCQIRFIQARVLRQGGKLARIGQSCGAHHLTGAEHFR